MQKLPETSDGKRGDACAKKRDRPDKKEESHSLSAVTSGVTKPCSLVEDAMRLSLDDALANPSTGSSRLFHYQPMTKTPDLDEPQKVTNHTATTTIPQLLGKKTYLKTPNGMYDFIYNT